MTIVVNGQEREAPDGVSVIGLLETIGLPPGRVAVELNGAVIRRADFSRCMIAENDRVEVVHFVGGG